jgi:hypothetical protein
MQGWIYSTSVHDQGFHDHGSMSTDPYYTTLQVNTSVTGTLRTGKYIEAIFMQAYVLYMQAYVLYQVWRTETKQ